MATDKTVKALGEGDEIQPVPTNQIATGNDNIKHTKAKEADQAAEFLASVGPFPPMTPEQEKKLIRKIDIWMIPMV